MFIGSSRTRLYMVGGDLNGGGKKSIGGNWTWTSDPKNDDEE